MKNTILIRPNSSEQYQSLNKIRALEPPLWLAIMANCYENPIIIDAEADNLNLESAIFNIKKHELKEVIVLATGSHPSAFIQQKESMNRLADELRRINNIKVKTYDYLPVNPIHCGNPKWKLLDMNKYRCHNWHGWGRKDKSYGVTYSSISCFFNCQFCSIKSFYRTNYQIRPIQEVINDIEYLYTNYGITNFKMMDELFVTNNRKTFTICEQLADLGKYINIWAYARIDIISEQLLKQLKRAGINWLAYGIESGNDGIRKSVLKGHFDKNKIKDVIKMTKDNGINIVGNYMFGFWEDDLNTMQETLDFAIELNTEYANFYCVVAYPDSELANIMKGKRVKLPENPLAYAQMSKEFEPLSTKYLSNGQVLKFRDEAFKTYFSNLKYLSMMQDKFGFNTVNEIVEMVTIDIERNLLQ